ncbi:hypothetical protein QOT17_012831 [Balamuthia mandrillaris]
MPVGLEGHGEAYFHALTEFLAKTSGFDYVGINVLVHDSNMEEETEMMSLYSLKENIHLPPFRSKLAGSPCENVALKSRSVCVFTAKVAQIYPEDDDLVRMGAQCYLGTPLWDTKTETEEERPLGVLCMVSRSPLAGKDVPFMTSLLQTFALKTAEQLSIYLEERRDKGPVASVRTVTCQQMEDDESKPSSSSAPSKSSYYLT